MPVKKEDAPLLIIGLGGTGGAAAYSVKKAFQERLELTPGSDCPPRTRFLIIDTDADEQKKYGWSGSEFFSIENYFPNVIKTLLPWEKSWLDPEFTDSFNWLGGNIEACMCRQVSRLFLFRRVAALYPEIIRAINDARKLFPGADPYAKLRICVLAGIAGGTGGGILLDVAYLIRYVLEHGMDFDRWNYSLEGMLVMPDVTIAHHATGETTREELYKANGYATLKEIDFWMNYATHRHRYTQQYSHGLTVDWASAPFDDLVLLTAANLDCVRFGDPHERCMRTIAEYMVSRFSAVDFERDIIGYSASYDAMRSNDLAQLNTIRKEFFVPYRYRSIGAFFNAEEEAYIRNRQWDLILEELVRSIDKNRPLMDGVEPVNFRKLCIDQTVGCALESRLRRGYEDRHPIPDVFRNMRLEDLRKMSPEIAPHGTDYKLYQTSIDLCRSDERMTLVRSGKDALHCIFMDVACDLNRGPEYCDTLLTHASEGLLRALEDEERIAARKQQESESFIQDYRGLDGNCEKLYSAIRTTRSLKFLIGGRMLFENYKKNVNDLYAATQAAGYYRALKEAIPELKRYTKLYAALLGDMCGGLRMLREEYQQLVSAARSAAGEEGAAARLLDGEWVDGTLREALRGEMCRDILVRAAFKTISNAVDEAVKINQNCLSASEAAQMIQDGIEQVRGRCFSTIDSMGIEAKLSACGLVNDGEMDAYTKNTIMPMMLRGAKPMFNSRYDVSPELRNAVYSNIGIVPETAPSIRKGIMDYLEEKGIYSDLRSVDDPNRLTWITSVMGLPLLACAELEDMYKAYRKKRCSFMGIHLCMGEECGLDDPTRQNWSLLPEPISKRYVDLSKAEREARSYYTTRPPEGAYSESAKEDRALMIDVRFANEGGLLEPSATIQWKRPRPMEGSEQMTEDWMTYAIEAALADKTDPAAKIEALRALRERCDVIDITPGQLKDVAEAWASVLGIGEEVRVQILPESPEEEQQRLKSAWVRCYERAAFEFVSRNPQLLGRMRENQACFDLIDARIAELNAAGAEGPW